MKRGAEQMQATNAVSGPLPISSDRSRREQAAEARSHEAQELSALSAMVDATLREIRSLLAPTEAVGSCCHQNPSPELPKKG